MSFIRLNNNVTSVTLENVVTDIVDLENWWRSLAEPRVEHRLEPRRGRDEDEFVRVEYSILDSEGNVAQFRIVDEFRINPGLRLASGFRRLDGLDRGSAVTSRENVGK